MSSSPGFSPICAAIPPTELMITPGRSSFGRKNFFGFTHGASQFICACSRWSACGSSTSHSPSSLRIGLITVRMSARGPTRYRRAVPHLSLFGRGSLSSRALVASVKAAYPASVVGPL